MRLHGGVKPSRFCCVSDSIKVPVEDGNMEYFFNSGWVDIIKCTFKKNCFSCGESFELADFIGAVEENEFNPIPATTVEST